MGRLVKAEFIKLSKSTGYKILLLCAMAIGVFVGGLMLSMPMDIAEELGTMTGYGTYLSTLADTQFFMTFSIIFSAIFICNEFANRTFGMSLFSGCSRPSILLSKGIAFFIGLLPIVFAEPLVSGIMVSITKGFGEWTWSELILSTFLFVLGNMSIGAFCFMLAVFIKNIGGTIGAGLGAIVGIELLKVFPITKSLVNLTFLYQMNSLPQPESIPMFIVIIVLTLVVSLCAAILIFQKTELK